MAAKQSIQLGTVQETLLVPLYARAVDSRRKRPILNDRKAVEMVESIDWDFQRFNQRWRIAAATLRTAIFDVPVRDFLSRHPEGTVVEIGAGLNTRFERLDNGAVHWFDLDLPDSIELRKKFFTDSHAAHDSDRIGPRSRLDGRGAPEPGTVFLRRGGCPHLPHRAAGQAGAGTDRSQLPERNHRLRQHAPQFDS